MSEWRKGGKCARQGTDDFASFRRNSIVEFSQPEDAQKAITQLSDTPLLGRPVFIREVSIRIDRDTSTGSITYALPSVRIAKMRPDMAPLPAEELVQADPAPAVDLAVVVEGTAAMEVALVDPLLPVRRAHSSTSGTWVSFAIRCVAHSYRN